MLLAFENPSEGAEGFLGWAPGLSAETRGGSDRMALSIQGIKTRPDSRMSPLWLCPRLENCDQDSFIVKKDRFLAIAELSLVPPPGKAVRNYLSPAS